MTFQEQRDHIIKTLCPDDLRGWVDDVGGAMANCEVIEGRWGIELLQRSECIIYAVGIAASGVSTALVKEELVQMWEDYIRFDTGGLFEVGEDEESVWLDWIQVTSDGCYMSGRIAIRLKH